MKIPIYSNLKAKLESKGLDSITSGQIAWFVCSFGLALIVYSVMILDTVFLRGVANFSYSFDILIVILFFCLIFNLFYIYNAIPLVLSVVGMLFIIFQDEFSKHFLIISCFVFGILFLLSLVKKKFIFGVLLALIGYLISYAILTAIGTYH